MVEKLMGFNFKFHYVPAEENKILDCFSRLTREIREAEHFEVSDSVLADHSLINKIKKVSLKENAQEDDPWVEHLGNVAMTDPDYINMVHHVEVGTAREDIHQDCELSELHNWQNNLSVMTLKGGQSLILKDNCKILIPKKEWDNILNIAHANTHLGYNGMVHQLCGKG